MCANCGCEGDKAVLVDLQTGATTPIDANDSNLKAADDVHDQHHDHRDDDPSGPHDHAHQHDHNAVHSHSAGANHRVHGRHGEGSALDVVEVETRILAKNDALAEKNRAWFAGREILALNVVSSPGAGKTTLLERTIRDLAGEIAITVVEADQATANDAQRIRHAGAAVVQINTGTGCHLDAEMVRRAVAALKPPPGALVLIENVGNLVCPALFDLGERGKIVMFPITDGEDKPLKYPHMFSAASVVIINKIDLLPHLDFSMAQAIANVRRVNPQAVVLQISARTGEGIAAWYEWLRRQCVAAQESTFA